MTTYAMIEEYVTRNPGATPTAISRALGIGTPHVNAALAFAMRKRRMTRSRVPSPRYTSGQWAYRAGHVATNRADIPAKIVADDPAKKIVNLVALLGDAENDIALLLGYIEACKQQRIDDANTIARLESESRARSVSPIAEALLKTGSRATP